MKQYEIGQHIYIGDNSFITEGDAPFVDGDESNSCRYKDFTCKEAIVLTEPQPQIVKLIGVDHPIVIERIIVQLLEDKKEYSVNNGYHSSSLEEVQAFIAQMNALAKDLAELSDADMEFDDNDDI